jgi:hypothetical protein
MSEVKCFWAERLPKLRRQLRRFSFEHECPIQNPNQTRGCGAMAPLDIIEYSRDIIEIFDFPKDSNLWPTMCERCGYQFQKTDQWQVFSDFVYKNTETGQEIHFKDLPPGAMYDSHWMKPDYRGEDGISLTVVLPDGIPWIVDGPAFSNGKITPGGWKRSGTIPKVTAQPSIQTPTYHGWLIEGVLKD